VVLRAGLDAVAKRKKSLHCHCWESNSSHPAPSLVTILTELPQLLPLLEILKKSYQYCHCFVLKVYEWFKMRPEKEHAEVTWGCLSQVQ
jgi:hypothetical protein